MKAKEDRNMLLKTNKDDTLLEFVYGLSYLAMVYERDFMLIGWGCAYLKRQVN